ncbi:hypothetical protein WOSG25_050870 [Weissella oryzae SG25]|uniref:Uncharacterized protein n=1 Tax=Weissella oryzae (strain DSM 25784 / JCM 18191 / LMG 30913 / SG25) TaxID=1329250 RepID=A0A069CSP5_WEIOS|nr:DUF1310 family protein [Weissella oryzae]GAK30815.1 hypothetical protein WOSG25_050870 [Weissella oryzae SG25]
MIEVEGASLQTEMVRIANSKEAEKIILSQLAKNDPNHKINKIQIIDKTVHKSLSGGVLFEGFINDDEALNFNAGINIEENKYIGTNITPRARLCKFLESGVVPI